MKKFRILMYGMFLTFGILLCSNSFADSETCVIAVGGNGHCVSLSVPGGTVVGYQCDYGYGVPPCYYPPS